MGMENFEQEDKNKNNSEEAPQGGEKEESGKSEEAAEIEVVTPDGAGGRRTKKEGHEKKKIEEVEKEKEKEKSEVSEEIFTGKAEELEERQRQNKPLSGFEVAQLENIQDLELKALGERERRNRFLLKNEAARLEELKKIKRKRKKDESKKGKDESQGNEDEGGEGGEDAGGDKNKEKTSVDAAEKSGKSEEIPEIEVVTPDGAGGRRTEKEEEEMKNLQIKKEGEDESISKLDNIRLDKLENKSLYNLEETRKKYIEQYQEFLRSGRLGRLRNSLGISPSKKQEMSDKFTEAKEKYTQAKQEYAQDEWKTSVENLSSDSSDEEIEKEKTRIKNEIYQTAVLDEYDKLQKAKAETFPPSEKGTLSKTYQWWKNKSKFEKIASSTAMAGGAAAFASLGTPVSSAAVAIGVGGAMGQKALRGTLGTLLSVGAGKTYDKFTKGKKKEIEQTATNEREKAKKSFSIDNLAKIEEQYQEAMKQEEKGNKKILMWKIGVMATAGIGTTVGVGMLDNCIAGELSSDTGGKLDTKSETGANPADAEKESTEPAAAASKPTEDLESYSVEKGDNLWDALKNNIPQFEELKASGMKDNVTANLIEKIKEEGPEKITCKTNCYRSSYKKNNQSQNY